MNTLVSLKKVSSAALVAAIMATTAAPAISADYRYATDTSVRFDDGTVENGDMIADQLRAKATNLLSPIRSQRVAAANETDYIENGDYIADSLRAKATNLAGGRPVSVDRRVSQTDTLAR